MSKAERLLKYEFYPKSIRAHSIDDLRLDNVWSAYWFVHDRSLHLLSLFCGSRHRYCRRTTLQGIYNSYTLLSVPLFIIAANFMSLGAMSDKLMQFCNALVGRFRGGMGHVNVISSLIFAGMSGSAVADAVGIGKLTIEMMVKDGRYTPSYAAAITAATAVIGPIIPPSIPMVLYALVSDASIGYLFLAGVIPGILMALVMSIVNWRMAIKHNFPVEAPVPCVNYHGLLGSLCPH